MRKTLSAGGVVLNARGEVLVVNQNGNSWSLPKGHLDPGETPLQAARREIDEESGVTDLTLVRELGFYQRHKIGKDGGEDLSEMKTLFMFFFTTRQEALSPKDAKNPEARLHPDLPAEPPWDGADAGIRAVATALDSLTANVDLPLTMECCALELAGPPAR